MPLSHTDYSGFFPFILPKLSQFGSPMAQPPNIKMPLAQACQLYWLAKTVELTVDITSNLSTIFGTQTLSVKPTPQQRASPIPVPISHYDYNTSDESSSPYALVTSPPKNWSGSINYSDTNHTTTDVFVYFDKLNYGPNQPYAGAADGDQVAFAQDDADPTSVWAFLGFVSEFVYSGAAVGSTRSIPLHFEFPDALGYPGIDVPLYYPDDVPGGETFAVTGSATLQVTELWTP